MTTIKEHASQSSSERLVELNKILKRGTLTREEWRMTAKFIGNEVEYAGLGIINVLDTGEFTYKDFKSNDLEEVENKLWRDASEKFWCKNC